MDKNNIKAFYRLCVFGSEADNIKAAAMRAYRDMCRTIRFRDKKSDKNSSCYNDALGLITTKIRAFCSRRDSEINRNEYDNFHTALCTELTMCYPNDVVEFFEYGQSQKWVNMTMKYLCILNEGQLDLIYPYLHVPIDNIVLDAAEKQHNILRPRNCWSKLKKEEYDDFQTAIRNAVNKSPMDWEFEIWNNQSK